MICLMQHLNFALSKKKDVFLHLRILTEFYQLNCTNCVLSSGFRTTNLYIHTILLLSRVLLSKDSLETRNSSTKLHFSRLVVDGSHYDICAK